MYNGNENLINDGEYLQYTMLDFWKWAYSNLSHNMLRGKFAEFIVKSALDKSGYTLNPEVIMGIEPFDLNGPRLPFGNRNARLEVKSAAYLQSWDIRHPEKGLDSINPTFSIAPAKLPDKDGDFNKDAPRQRNNDVYIFSLYTAKSRRCNILDLSWWEFYIIPTFVLDENPELAERKTISLKKIKQLNIQPTAFQDLCEEIVTACNSIPEKYCNKPLIFTPPPKNR